MDFNLNDEQKMMRQVAAEIADEQLAPRAEEMEENREIPADLLAFLAEQGYFGLFLPEAYGGVELDPVTYALTMEEFSRGSPAVALVVSVQNALVGLPILKYGTEEQKEKYLARAASGELFGAFALSEDEAGSDAASVQLRAEKKNGGYVLTGHKKYITNAGFAGLFLVVARTGPEPGAKGLSCFLVERDAPGFALGERFEGMGMRALDVRRLEFENCEVPAEALLGAEGEGLKIALASLDLSRIGVAGQAVGIGQQAFNEARRYAGEREQFGRPIIKFQGIQFYLAEMATRLEAARLLMLRAAARAQAGEPFSAEAAMAKLYASETANFCANLGVQIHGGYGYMRDYVVERFYRDARVTEIYEGTSEIQKLIIAGSILKG
ncbi:MAG: acyl-CoA dehydrogenase family protein [Candidatus Coatesbacteria bacterium]|nr:MAG: acyl-CoA dehydrogenase family protein [Candidatus Coatesbacteria bacterium]